MRSRFFLGIFISLAAIAAFLSAPAARAADITVVASFVGSGNIGDTNGKGPLGGVTLDSSGNLYGTTELGGPANYGTVWEIAHGSTTVTTLASFSTTSADPYSGVTLDSIGNLYGTTTGGGTTSDGTLWELPHGSATVTTLADFAGTHSGVPNAVGVTIDSSGNLFGTTKSGINQDSTYNLGTVWEVPRGGTFTTLATFPGDNMGDRPGAPGDVVVDSSGNLFGTVFHGDGQNHVGGVFELPHGGTTPIILAYFTGTGNLGDTNGEAPNVGITQDSSGNLYGTTELGGSAEQGTVWELPHGSATIITLASFTGTGAQGVTNGRGVYAGVTLDSSGNLFGTTTGGGVNDDGTVWEIVHGTTTLTTLASFNKTNGAHPYCRVTIDSRGNLYGTAASGGTANKGVIWEIPATAPPPTPHTHVLWNNTNGTASLWNYDTTGGTYTQNSFGPYSGWSARAIADGGTDGLTRVLWDNANGQMSLWSLNNTVSGGSFTQHSFGPFAGWTAKAVSVGIDNTTHVLWTNTNGTASIWNYSTASGTYTQNSFGPYPGWIAVAIADGPDSLTRVLWGNTDGHESFWSLNNSVSGGDFRQKEFGTYAGWTANALSVGADNTMHILWDNSDGRLSLWNYSTNTGSFTQNTYGPFSGWFARGVADGSDGVTRVLWGKTDGQVSLWGLDNTTASYTHHEFGPFAGWTATAVSAVP